MSVFTIILLCAAAVTGAGVIFRAMWKSGHFIKSLFLSAIQGITAVAAVNLAGLITGVSIGVNVFNLIFACLAGIPGVILILVFKFL